MKAALYLFSIAFLIQLLGETSSAAYQLEPISRVFAPAGSKATQSFEVVNDSAERIAVTVSFTTLSRDESYVETTRDADDEFLAYPPQVIVAAHGRQTVRVSWLGAAKLTREQTYRIIVAQVPIEVLDRTAKPSPLPAGQLRVMITYRGTLFIRPAQAAPKIAIRDAVLATSAKGRTLALTLENSGTAVGVVKSCAVTVTPASGGAAISVSTPTTVNTRILAGTRRRYVLPWPAALAAGPVTANGSCSYEP